MAQKCPSYLPAKALSFAIDHRTWKTGLPVRSAVLKPCAGRLVVGWVTTSEYLLLIVFAFSHLCHMSLHERFMYSEQWLFSSWKSRFGLGHNWGIFDPQNMM